MDNFQKVVNEFLNFEIVRLSDFQLTPGKILAILIIGGITHLLLLIFKGFLFRQVKQHRIDTSVYYAIYQLTRYFAVVIALGVMLEALGIRLNFLIASAAALMVGIGIGLQHLFEDFISGIILLVDRTIKVDDVIQVEQIIGRVLAIKLRYTEVLSRDRYHLLIPNSKITRDKVINFTHQNAPVRFDILVSVAFDSDAHLVEKLLLACANELTEVEESPAPSVQLFDFQDSGMQFRLLFYSKDAYGIDNVKSRLRVAIIEMFREHHINIPFPQREVYLKQ